MNYIILYSEFDVSKVNWANTKKRPEQYPCFVYYTEEGGGLAGSYRYTNIAYIPRECDVESYVKGYIKGGGYD